MLKGFEGYYQPDFDKLWNDAIFVFDTNVLLDLYRSSPKSRKEMIDILEGLDGRIWIPHQFFHEYHNQKATIYDSINNDYETWENNLQKSRKSAINGLQEELGKIKNRTGLEIDPLNEQVASIFEDILRDLAESREQHMSNLNDEPPEKKIAQLFAESYGEPFEDSCLENIRKLANERLKKGMPPGSEKDNRKDKSDPDGDLIGWLQTIKYANDEKKPIILVSKDGDWFLSHKGKIKGPYPALLQEMYDKAEVSCYIYKPSQFIKHAQNYLDAQVSEETIEETEGREKYVDEQESVREQLAPRASRAGSSGIPSISDVLMDITPPVDDSHSIMKQIREEQQRIAEEQQSRTDAMMKPYLDEQRRIAREQQRRTDAIMKSYLDELRRIVDQIMKNSRL